MNAPARTETIVVPINRGKELKGVTCPSRPEETTDLPAIRRRLAHCLQMAAELLLEINPTQ